MNSLKNIISWSDRYKTTLEWEKFGCTELGGYFRKRPYIYMYCFWLKKVKKTNIQRTSCTLCPFLHISPNVWFILLQVFSHFYRFISPFVNAGEYICETYICDFALMKLVLIDLVNCQSLNFGIIAGFLLYSFSSDLCAFSILSRISSTIGITLLITLVKMSILLSQDSRFLGWGVFLKIRVFLRLLFFISSMSSFITVTSSLRADISFFNWSLFSIFSVLFFYF